MSLVIPGLGQLYAGRALRGLAVALGAVAFGAAMLQLGMVVPVRAVRIATLLLLVAPRLFAAADAVRVASAAPRPYTLRRYNRWYVYAAVIFVAQLGGRIVKEVALSHLARAWKIPTSAMEPTLLPGDFIVTSPRPFTVRRGGLVTYGDGSGEGFIHRVVAAPGDVVEMRRKTLWLNGRPVAEPYVRHGDAPPAVLNAEMQWQLPYLTRPSGGTYTPTRDDWGPLRVPAGQYLLLADNRDESYDGRWRGFVPREAITARVVWIYFSYGPDAVRWERIGASVR